MWPRSGILRSCPELLLLLALVQSASATVLLRSEFVAGGLTNPVFVTAAPGDSQRLFVPQRAGLIRVIKDGAVLATPFLDLSAKTTTISGEMGLLGMAFHPEYATNGFFYVNYTDLNGHTAVVRYTVSGDPQVADAGSESVVLQFNQPDDNHNGGMLFFGPNDGYLYIASGDGGEPVSPSPAEDIASPLGKVLRVDVSTPPYAIPPTNPFAGVSGADERVWCYGLRNPWRPSFDRSTGDLWIADVGQSRYEEINFQPAASAGGQHYGWRVAEGFVCYPSGSGTCGSNSGFTPPILAYGREVGRSITGGYVYRGAAIPDLQGKYVYGDFMDGRVWSLRYNGSISDQQDHTSDLQPPGRTLRNIISFGEDNEGELYIVNYTDGEVYKILPVEGVWADFAYAGTESGSFAQPYNSLAEAVAGVTLGGDIRIKGDSAVTSSAETPTLSKPMRILAIGGTVRIGAASKSTAPERAAIAVLPAGGEDASQTQQGFRGGQPTLTNIAEIHQVTSILGTADAARDSWQWVLPGPAPGGFHAEVAAYAPVAIRARGALKPNSIRVSVQPVTDLGYRWSRVDGAETDGWILVTPKEAWPKEGFSIQASWKAAGSGELIESGWFRFDIAAESTEAAIPGVYRFGSEALWIAPEQVYDAPTPLWIPVSPSDASRLRLEYYCTGADGSGWRPATAVAGFMAGSEPKLEHRGADTGLSLSVHHGGYLRVVLLPADAGDR